MATETIELRGHLIDSLLLPRVLDEVLAAGGTFEIEEVRIGVRREDPSYARVRVQAESESALDAILARLKLRGAEVAEPGDAVLAAADVDGAFPEDFYATTNLETLVRVGGRWVTAEEIGMDCGIVVDPRRRQARCAPMHLVRRGDLIVVGHRGVRVVPLERMARGHLFEFMGSDVSPEKPKGALVQAVARELARAKAEGRKTLFVGGPAVIHTGGGEALAEMVRGGYVSVLFAGNGLAAHDIESAFYGTALGVRLAEGALAPGGHRNHLRAINTIRRLGGIGAAVEAGVLTKGVMHACVTRRVPFVLAGSIRDDGPLPEVITDTVQAKETMRAHIRGVDFALVVASTLHAVATGNLLPAQTRLVVVDIDPAPLTKLSDRGSFQTVGIVSDAGLFLRRLADTLTGRATGEPGS